MSTSQQADPLIGRLVDGRYRVRARIARGGMATVYVATDMRLERRVALKVMHGHLSDDVVFQSRFIQEARAAARLADPHVVNVFDQGQDGEMAYLVMEYLPGITLRELLREQRRLTVAQTVTIMDAILSGLAAAHRAGIVHRDVKPENVLLAEDGRIKIGDFGLARATTANTASGQMLLGTIAYLAPELVTRGSADARSDIYALGIMMYEMLVGEQPYKGEQPMQIAYQHATDSVPRPSAKNPAVPEQLDELVLWATEKVPDDRPLDADVMLSRLREIERELGVAPQVARAVAVGTDLGDDTVDSGELTKVFPQTGSVTTASGGEVDNASRLRSRMRRRTAVGAWLLGLVIVLAGLAAGVGWWFGSGPGSLVAVPDVGRLPFAEAQAALAERELVAAPEERFHFDIPAGTTIDTDPPAGSRVDKESTIVVRVSAGPAPHDVQPLEGVPASDARRMLHDLNLQVAEPDAEEFTDAERGDVIGVTVTSRLDGSTQDCLRGCRVVEGDSVALLVSRGPVPSVAGSSVSAATATLTGVGLDVGGQQIRRTSETIDAGDVIGIAEREGGGNWRPGDTVTLIVSTGPPLYPIPEVTNLTRDEAIARLENAGFQVDYAVFWAPFPNSLTRVTGSDPAAGEQRVRGTRVYLQITASG